MKTPKLTTKPLSLLTALGLAAMVSACGGGGGGDAAAPSSPTVLTGYFKDSSVEGLSYQTTTQSGTTGANGQFSYVAGEEVHFSIGGVTLGSATGDEILTPVSLVEGGSSSSPAVINMVRFLMMLDSDGDPTNGISINIPAETASGWTITNFASDSFAADVSQIVADVAVVYDDIEVSLPNETTAQTHMESTLRCAYSGAYMGTFDSDTDPAEDGVFGVVARASDGKIIGYGYNNLYNLDFSLEADATDAQALSFEQTPTFVGASSDGGTFSGSFSSVNTVAGTWDVAGEGGSFSGSRIGGALNAKYRFTGRFGGSAFGLFAFDIDANNQITGFGYDVQHDETFSLTGTLTGTVESGTINMSESGGTSGVTATATITNMAIPAGTGSWENSEGDFGGFGASGCQLN